MPPSPCLDGVGIPITTLDALTGTVADPLDRPRPGGDVKVATGADGDPSHIGSPLFPPLHHGSHQISGGEAFYPPRLLGRGTREAELVHPAHLAGTVSGRQNEQGMDLLRV